MPSVQGSTGVHYGRGCGSVNSRSCLILSPRSTRCLASRTGFASALQVRHESHATGRGPLLCGTQHIHEFRRRCVWCGASLGTLAGVSQPLSGPQNRRSHAGEMRLACQQRRVGSPLASTKLLCAPHEHVEEVLHSDDGFHTSRAPVSWHLAADWPGAAPGSSWPCTDFSHEVQDNGHEERGSPSADGPASVSKFDLLRALCSIDRT